MTEAPTQGAAQAEQPSRPDLVFKLLTHLEAQQNGLEASETELQYSTRTDLVLKVPPGLNLQNTMFDFFRAINVLEFKSDGDKFNLREFARNETRTTILFLQSTAETFDSFLNVLVLSRLPRKFLDYAKKQGITFQREKDKAWLWHGKVGFQDVAIVVCRDLPLEKRYYAWLIFAPADTRKWQQFIWKLVRERNSTLLDTIRNLRPKEYAMVTETIWNQLESELKLVNDDPKYYQDVSDALKILMDLLAEKSPNKVDEFLDSLDPKTFKLLTKKIIERNQN